MMALKPRTTARVLILILTTLALVVPQGVDAQTAPEPKPDDVPFYYDATNTFNDEQLRTLRRDAELLQSSEIPTLVYVREVSAEDANVESSQEFADTIRQAWDVESAEGADDGLVLLFSWVPENPTASTVVQSYGAATFDGSGLSPESIEHTIDTSVHSLLEQGKPFETLVYLMRETRYTGIYAPPPPPPVEGLAQTIHVSLDWLGPIITGLTIIALIKRSRDFWRQGPTSEQVWRIVGVTVGTAVLLWIVSVYAQSRAGVASALLILPMLAFAVWMWTHPPFTTHDAMPVRQRNVPATRRLVRQRQQARKMFTRATGGSR